jgi:hypothetical protein
MLHEDITRTVTDYIGLNDADPLQYLYWESSQADLYKVFTEELCKHHTIQLIAKEYNANTSKYSPPNRPSSPCT